MGPTRSPGGPGGRSNTSWTHLSVTYPWGPLGPHGPTLPDKTQRPHTRGSNHALSLSLLAPRTNSKAHGRAPPPPRPMSPPVSSGAPVQERRLGVLLSHLRPCAPPAARRGNHHHHHHHDLRVREAEGTGGLAASPCAADGSGETSGGQRCVFCEIVKGNKPAYKVLLTRSAAAQSPSLLWSRVSLLLQFAFLRHFVR